jgi:hypothetical protein
VLARPAEQISLSRPFGAALHKTLERYYRSYAQGHIEELGLLQELFCEVFSQQLSDKKALIVFGKTIPDADSAIVMGKAMIEAFYASIDLSLWRVIDVELAPVCPALYGCGANHRV